MGSFSGRIAAGAIGALAAATPAMADEGGGRLAEAFFGGRSAVSNDTARIPGWSSLLARETVLARETASASGLSLHDRFLALVSVNREVNAARYVSDEVNWNARDHWGTSEELRARGGDCEDFAAAKYFELRDLGFAAEDLRIAIVFDEEVGARHAILLARIAGEVFVLDNRRADVLLAADLGQYRPIVAMNEDAWWLAPRQTPVTRAPIVMASFSR